MKKRNSQKTVSMGAISEFQPEMTIIKIDNGNAFVN